jgi:menaquinone-9 beta-reductase
LGCAVQLIEKSKLPRHKVCGEFLSPEIEADLERLGLWQAFLAAGPSRIRRMKLNFGRREKEARLADGAWGLSRYTFDTLMLENAVKLGAEVRRYSEDAPVITACGRGSTGTVRGRRLFGFKAHFEGPADDAVELFFFGRCYVGVNAVENGRTNVCGLAPEDFLKRFDFDFDQVVRQSPALIERLEPLNRSMEWLSTGPLDFRQNFTEIDSYRAGDALSFVDPFTGTGLVAAVKTGGLAGEAAAKGLAIADYLEQCGARLRKPFEVAAVFRKALNLGFAETLAPFVPSRLMFALTRPRKDENKSRQK